MQQKVRLGFFVLLLLLIIFLAGKIVAPYFAYIVIAAVIAFATYPVYSFFRRKFRNKNWATIFMLVIIILVLIIPSAFLLRDLVKQGSATLSSIDLGTIERLDALIQQRFSIQLDLQSSLNTLVRSTQNFLINQSLNVLSSIADVIIGLVIMFFCLFYFFRDGKKIYRNVASILPLEKDHRELLFGEMKLITNAVIYGQLLAALAQGFLGGIGFVIFGIPNAVFWGFIMALLSFFPIVGTPLVFVPAGILQISAGNYVSGVGILIYGSILVANIYNVIKPLIISDKTRLNPALILISVIGGIKAFGFIGFIIGPMVIALLIAFLEVFKQDFQPSVRTYASKEEEERAKEIDEAKRLLIEKEKDERERKKKDKGKGGITFSFIKRKKSLFQTQPSSSAKRKTIPVSGVYRS